MILRSPRITASRTPLWQSISASRPSCFQGMGPPSGVHVDKKKLEGPRFENYPPGLDWEVAQVKF